MTVVIYRPAESDEHYCATADDTLGASAAVTVAGSGCERPSSAIIRSPPPPTGCPSAGITAPPCKEGGAWQERFSAKGYAPGSLLLLRAPQTLTNKTIQAGIDE